MASAVPELERAWVVLRAASLRWCTLQLPSPVVAILGLRSGLGREHRRIAFLGRGDGVVRVVPAVDPPADTSEEVSGGAALGFATPTDRFLFTLPRSVQRYLGLRIFPRIGGRAHGSNDLVAWVTPHPDGPEPSDRVYLVRSLFRGLISVHESPMVSREPTTSPER